MAQVRSGGNSGGMAGSIARAARAVLCATALAVGGCGSLGKAVDSVAGPSGPTNGMPGYVKGFLGSVVADEPSAALVGREVLSAGGTAADAAVAVGFALSVTLPSRAGLGGGGACLAYGADRKGPNHGVPEAFLFVPPAPAHPGAGDRPAAVPLLARGLFLLHSRYGTRQFESLLGPAEDMARSGVTVSRSLAHDLSVVAGPLAADSGARSVFFPAGAPLQEGQRFVQPGMAATLSQLRRAGVGDLYQGGLAHVFADSARDAGAALSAEDLRGALPTEVPALLVPAGTDMVAFLPPPADGGLAAAAAFNALRSDPAALDAAGARALAVAARWRQGSGSPAAVLAAAPGLPAATLPPLPASAGFAVLDRNGNAVICALTMNNLFGTGRVAAGTGILLAASPAVVPPPLLAAAVAYDPRRNAFRAAVTGTGQQGAALSAAAVMARALAGAAPYAPPLPAPGRADVIACTRGLPGDPRSCTWAADPNGSGLALGQAAGALPPGAPAAPKPLPDNYAPAPGIPLYR